MKSTNISRIFFEKKHYQTSKRTTSSKRRTPKSGDGQLILPLITLRALIITPNSKLQITAARKSSIAALDYANAQEQKHLAVFCQLNEHDEVCYRLCIGACT